MVVISTLRLQKVVIVVLEIIIPKIVFLNPFFKLLFNILCHRLLVVCDIEILTFILQ